MGNGDGWVGRGLRIIENLLQGTGQEIGAEASKLIEKSEKKKLANLDCLYCKRRVATVELEMESFF